MRLIVGFLAVAALAGGVYKYTRHAEVAAPAQIVSATPARTTSEHDWPKSSLDRADELKRQLAQQHKENGD